MNKINSRVVSFKLALLLLLCCLPSAAEESTAETEQRPLTSEAFYILDAMGFLGEEIAESDAEGEFSRAQFAGTLFHIAGYQTAEYKNAEIPFIDVNAETPWKNEICALYSMGIVDGNGKGTFSPDAAITYEQAVKLAVTVLGYREYTEAKYGGGMTGYVNMAASLKLNRGITIGVCDAPLTAEGAIQLLYNTGRTEVMEPTKYTESGASYEIRKGEELFQKYNKIYYGRGIVQSDGIVSLTNEEAAEGAAVIDEEIYRLSEYEISDYLGCRVRFFYREESEIKTILWAEGDAYNNVVLISAADLLTDDSRYSLTNIVYANGEKTAELKIDEYADIVYNNISFNTLNEIKPKSGTVKLIDNNGDGKFDIVIIKEFENLFVTAVIPNSSYIFDKYGSTVYLDEYQTIKVFMDGKNILPEDIPANRVISALKSPDKKLLFLYVNEAGVTDTLQKVTADNLEERYTFSDKTYSLANSYKWRKENPDSKFSCPEIKPGVKYKYFLDIDGNIAEIADAVNDLLQYAYIMKANMNNDLFADSESAKFRLLLSDGTKTTATAIDKIKSMDERFGETVVTGKQILQDSRFKTESLVKVRLNAKGEIKEFYFPNGADIGFAEDPFTGERMAYDYDPNPNHFTRNYTYGVKRIDGVIVNSKCEFFGSRENMFAVQSAFTADQSAPVVLKYFATNSTLCFVKYTDMESDEPYAVTNTSVFADEVFYGVNLYDANEKMEISAVTTEKGMSGAGNEFVLIDSVCSVKDDDGEIKTQINGWRYGKQVSFTEMYAGLLSKWVKSSTFPYSELQRGDVIRLGLYDGKIVSAKGVVRFGNERNMKNSFCIGNNSRSYTLFGRLYSVGEDVIVNITPDSVKDTNGVLTVTSLGGTRNNLSYITIYDRRTDTICQGQLRDISQIQGPDKNGELPDTANDVWTLMYSIEGFAQDIILVYY